MKVHLRLLKRRSNLRSTLLLVQHPIVKVHLQNYKISLCKVNVVHKYEWALH